MKETLLVIGNGMAGMHAVEELLRIAPDEYNIIVFGAEPYGNYNRIMLTPVLYGAKQIDEIMIHDFDWYKKNNITLYCGQDKMITAIDTQARTVTTADADKISYDRLLIATGSRSLILPIPGHAVEGVMGFRDIADVEKMIRKAETHHHAVVLGGGLLGLEAANGLSQRGMEVTVVNRSRHILNKQLDKTAGDMLQSELQQKNIAFRLGLSIKEINHHDGHINAVTLDDNSRLAADILVMATGIVPNTKLAEQAGIECDRGILVDHAMLTSDPRIYAVGECVQHGRELFGLVAPVYQQAKVCAENLAEHGRARFKTSIHSTVLKVSGIDLFSMGELQSGQDSETLTHIDHHQRLYRKLVLKNNKLIGIIMYGNTRDIAWYQQLLLKQTDIADIRDQLIFGKPETLAA